jgi:hypothetical protein
MKGTTLAKFRPSASHGRTPNTKKATVSVALKEHKPFRRKEICWDNQSVEFESPFPLWNASNSWFQI